MVLIRKIEGKQNFTRVVAQATLTFQFSYTLFDPGITSVTKVLSDPSLECQ